MFYILQRLRADVVFHAAAYKHVPLMEANPVATISNNVFGTKALIDSSVAAEVKQFVMISTDKAVEPRSVYGASKLIAEELVLRERRQGRQYLVVRFGNVLGSRGSILPKFTQQILKGGPVTLTDPAASRYFMTIPEAVTLVLKVGGLYVDGDLLILDMGKPVLIRELAEQLIHFHGYLPDKDVKIVYTGLRPGEKLTEKLWADQEHPEPTGYDRILKVEKATVLNGELDDALERLRVICSPDENSRKAYRNRRQLRRVLHDLIPSIEVPENEPEY